MQFSPSKAILLLLLMIPCAGLWSAGSAAAADKQETSQAHEPETTSPEPKRELNLDFDKGLKRLFGLERGGNQLTDESFIYWDRGLVVESFVPGRFKALIGFWGDYDLGYLDPDSNVAAAYPATNESGGELRRLRVYVQGYFLQYFEYKFQADITGDAQDRVDLWVGLKDIPKDGYVRMGYQKEPFSLEMLISASNTTMMERSLVNALAPGRNWGVQGMTTFFEERMTAALSLSNDNDEPFTSFGDLQDYTMRLTYLPRYENKGADLWHVGFNYSYRTGGDSLKYSTRPECYLATDRLINTENFYFNRAYNVGLEGIWKRGPTYAQGEVITSLADTDEGSRSFTGFYVQGSHFLTGEQRPYDRQRGIFGQVVPKEFFDIGKGSGWGAWEVAARLSYLDLNSGNIRGGRETDLTLGLNWYLNRKFRIMINYVYASVTDQPTLAGDSGVFQCLQTRLQFYF